MLALLKAIRSDVEADVEAERVDGHLGRGVYAYVGALIRLVEAGDRDAGIALNEARSAAGFLRAIPRLPPVRAWGQSCHA